MKYINRLKCAVPLFLLLLAGLAHAAGFGADIALADQASLSKDFSFLPTRSISADFDGDHRPDLASGAYHGQTYQVEIGFSTGKRPASIAFKASHFEFSIFAHDVDADNDQDLVIVSASSSSPAAVWLNNDEGHFEQGSRWWWATLLTSNDAPGFDCSNSRCDPVFLTQEYRSILQSSPAPHRTTLEVNDIIPQESRTRSTRILRSGWSNRAPPLNSASD